MTLGGGILLSIRDQ